MVDADARQAKRNAILSSALEVFVDHGFVGTTTDRLAAAASISKQTLYREFGDKEGVFAALIEFACDQVYDPFAPLVDELRTVGSAERAVDMMAEQFARSIISPRIQQLRRLVIAEAVRFPDLGKTYWENGFLRVLNSVADCLEVLDERGLLQVPEPRLAAEHFAGILLWIPSNQAMFDVSSPIDEDRLTESIADGARAFLRAYS